MNDKNNSDIDFDSIDFNDTSKENKTTTNDFKSLESTGDLFADMDNAEKDQEERDKKFKEENSFGDLPDSTYSIQVDKFETTEAGTGAKGFELVTNIVGGEYDGRKLFDKFYVKDRDGNSISFSLKRLKDFLEVVGIGSLSLSKGATLEQQNDALVEAVQQQTINKEYIATTKMKISKQLDNDGNPYKNYDMTYSTKL